MPFLDSFERPISYLRISVTDRCNFRCLYCRPAGGISLRRSHEILRYEEIERVARAAASLGINKVRLTGGEPLVRKGVVDLVEMLASIPGIDDISMTTNGALLANYAQGLAQAGLKRVNVSLDSLKEEHFREITRGGRLNDTLAGIDAARKAGLSPIKVNMVVVQGLNDDETLDFAGLSREGWHVRYIELMPLGPGVDWRGLSVEEIREEIESHLGSLEPAKVDLGGGPARYYRLPGAQGTIGFIAPLSECFCEGCNRLRLTADGRLRPCLLSDEEIEIKPPLRRGATLEELREIISQGAHMKPSGHRLAERVWPQERTMSEIGG